MSSIVRLQEIEIKNFKNVKYGKIEFQNKKKEGDFYNEAEILGIYGQNGSGKTALVESLKVIQKLISGESLPKDTYDLILNTSNNCEFKYIFYMEYQEKSYFLKYEVSISKKELNDKSVVINNESLSYKEYENGKWNTYKGIVKLDDKESIGPKYNTNYLNDIKNNFIDLNGARAISQKDFKSFIFSEEFSGLLNKVEKLTEIKELINNLRNFSKRNLFIIDNKNSSLVNGNIMIPLNFRCIEGEQISQGIIPLSLAKPCVLTKEMHDIVLKVIIQMNKVLSTIVPGLSITIKELGTEYNEESEEVMRFQLFSKREDVQIPIKYESDGIKKIISILSTLIVVYNNSSFSLVIDELDAGIFEYLLGEILQVISKYGKGQLIFTSHNLRPLEVLKSKNLRFTTINPNKKYVKLANIKKSNNVRSTYMRNILLGGEKETLYKETSNYKIKRAFKIAGCE